MISNHWEIFIKIQTSWISKRTMRILIGGHLNSPWFSDKPSSIFAATSRLFVFARNSRVWGLGLHSIKTLLHIIVTSYDRIVLNSEYCPQPQPCNHDSARASSYLTLACFFIDDMWLIWDFLDREIRSLSQNYGFIQWIWLCLSENLREVLSCDSRILCANETDIVSPEILPTVEEFLTSSCSEPFLMLAGDMLALQPTWANRHPENPLTIAEGVHGCQMFFGNKNYTPW